MRKTIGICLVILSLLGGCIGAVERGAFPEIGIGARPLAMGGAFVAVADSADALFWNPAGTNQILSRELSSMQTDLFGMSINYNWFGAVQPIGNWNIGLGYSGLDASEAFGSFPYKEESYLFNFSGSRFLAGQRVYWGINGKLFSLKGGSELVNSSQKGFGLDLGLLWVRRPWSAGIVVRDLGSTLSGTLVEDDLEKPSETNLPTTLALGVAYRQGKITWAMDLSEVITSPVLHLGVEYSVNNNVSVRCGYSSGSFTGGLGIKAGNWIADYAYNTHQAGDAQRFSLGYRF